MDTDVGRDGGHEWPFHLVESILQPVLSTYYFRIGVKLTSLVPLATLVSELPSAGDGGYHLATRPSSTWWGPAMRPSRALKLDNLQYSIRPSSMPPTSSSLPLTCATSRCSLFPQSGVL